MTKRQRVEVEQKARVKLARDILGNGLRECVCVCVYVCVGTTESWKQRMKPKCGSREAPSTEKLNPMLFSFKV